MKKIDSLEIAKKIIVNNGGQCLSTNYKNTKTKIKIQCSAGHVWMASIASIIYSKTWCIKCANIILGNKIRLDGIDLAQQIAKKHGGKCLSTEYINNKSILYFECRNQHRWHNSLNKIKDVKQWCRICAGLDKLSIIVANRIAIERGGRCITKKYKNIRTKMLWECANGHRWNCNLNHIKNLNSWCPFCDRLKSQKKLASLLEKILGENATQDFRGFDWLRYKNKLELDIWFPKLKLAIEYDGRQHFEPVRFGSISHTKAKQNLIKLKIIDGIKDKLIQLHPEDVNIFIRFNYKDKLTVEAVTDKLRKHNIIE